MSKSLCRSFSLLLALSLLAPFAQDAVARTPDTATQHARPSFKSGFSSQKAAPPPSPSYKPAPDRTASRNGGFGSFGGGRTDAAHRSESASSRELTRKQAEENALRTLEERRARSARRDEPGARPAPDDRAPSPSMPPSYSPPSYPPQDARRGGGLGDVVAGAVIANAINRHANAANNANYGGNRQAAPERVPNDTAAANDWGLGPKDGQGANAGTAKTAGQPRQQGASFARVLLWLCLLALLGAVGYVAWRRVQRKREADKPNYSFERN
jgi:hypothetical protein